MEAERRSLRRKPLSDCTNITTATSSKASAFKPAKPSLSTTKKPEKKNNSTKSDTTNINDNAQNPSSILPFPSTPLRSSNSARASTGTGEPLTVYGRRRTAEKRKNKEKMVAEPLSCPPVERIMNIGDKLNEVDGVGLSKLWTVPRKKKQHCLPHEKDVSKHASPQDFIEQQKAYFAEIDAFELPVEVVSDSELE